MWAPCLHPFLTPPVQEALTAYERLLREVNATINLVSRKEIAALREHHLLPALLLLCLLPIEEGAEVLDLGTGGGLPGIPLAIARPDLRFLLVDSIRKKAEAVQRMVEALGLSERVRVQWARAETLPMRFPYIVGRAVAPLPKFLTWAKQLLLPGGRVYYYAGEPLPPIPPRWEATYHPFRQVIEHPYLQSKGVLSLRYA